MTELKELPQSIEAEAKLGFLLIQEGSKPGDQDPIENWLRLVHISEDGSTFTSFIDKSFNHTQSNVFQEQLETVPKVRENPNTPGRLVTLRPATDDDLRDLLVDYIKDLSHKPTSHKQMALEEIPNGMEYYKVSIDEVERVRRITADILATIE